MSSSVQKCFESHTSRQLRAALKSRYSFFPVSYRRGEGEALLRLLLHLHRLPPVVILQELLLVQRAGGDRRRLVALAPLRILASQLLLLPGSLLALALLGVQLDVVVEVLVLRHVVLQEGNVHLFNTPLLLPTPSLLPFLEDHAYSAQTTTGIMGRAFPTAAEERIVAEENAAAAVDEKSPLVARRERDGSREPFGM